MPARSSPPGRGSLVKPDSGLPTRPGSLREPGRPPQRVGRCWGRSLGGPLAPPRPVAARPGGPPHHRGEEVGPSLGGPPAPPRQVAARRGGPPPTGEELEGRQAIGGALAASWGATLGRVSPACRWAWDSTW